LSGKDVYLKAEYVFYAALYTGK